MKIFNLCLCFTFFCCITTAQEVKVPNILTTSSTIIKSMETDKGMQPFVFHEAFLMGKHIDKVFGKTLFNTTLYHYERRKACYINSLLMAAQLPVIVTGTDSEVFDKRFRQLSAGLHVLSQTTKVAGKIHTNYRKADNYAAVIDNFISKRLRKINPKSYFGIKVETNNLQHFSNAIKTYEITTLIGDVAYSAVIREALATDLALTRLALLEKIVKSRSDAGISIDPALTDAFEEARKTINKSDAYYGAVLAEMTERIDELIGMGLDEALIYIKKNYLTQALTKYFAHHKVILAGKSAATNASALAGLYATSVMVTYEVIDALLEQHEKVQTAITSATLSYLLSEETENKRLKENDLVKAMNLQLQYDSHYKMEQAFSGFLPLFNDLVGVPIRKEMPSREWRLYYRGLKKELKELMLMLDILELSEDTSSSSICFGFLIDSSGSMKDTDPKDIRKSALLRIADLFAPNEQVILIDFDDKATWLNPDNYKNIDVQELKQSVATINSDGGTEIGNSLKKMQEVLTTVNIQEQRTGIMLLSDGKSRYNNETTWFAKNDVPVYAVSYKNMGDPLLLSRIASETGGLYIQADNEEDVVAAFQQFYNMLSGHNKYASIRGSLKSGQSISRHYYVDPGTEKMYCSVSWTDSPLAFNVTDPDGRTFTSENSSQNWHSGSNYTLFETQKPVQGKWTANITNPDNMSKNAPYLFESGGKSELDYILSKIEGQKGLINYGITEAGGQNVSALKPEIKVTTPGGNVQDISSNYINGTLSYLPTEGKGNYQFEISFQTIAADGNNIQRYFNVSEFVTADFIPYVDKINYIAGNSLETPLGSNRGSYVGMKCYIYKPGDNINSCKAIGYVTMVTPEKCIIEIDQFINYEPLGPDDIVELDAEQWINSTKY